MKAPPRTVAITGADGVLGSRVASLLAGRALRLIDRTRGHELDRPSTFEELIRGCDAVIHCAALHPLVAPPRTGPAEYASANVVPLVALLEVARREGVGRLVLASTTSVWGDAPTDGAARFLDEDVPADADDGYARSKRECEALTRTLFPASAVLRLARFTHRGDIEDDVRLLYRAIDPDDAAAAVVAALDHAPAGALYAISAPTPFRPADAEELATDPALVIRRRTGHEPAWIPPAIRSVVLSDRATRELGWRAEHPSTLYRLPR